MKKVFLYLLAAIVLTSCDNLKKKDKADADEEEVSTKKKKKALDDDEENADEETPKKRKVADDEDVDDEITNKDKDNDNNDDTNSDDTGGWTSTERNTFLKECVANVPQNVGEVRGRAYCACFLNKVESKFPSYTQANAKMTQTELTEWAAECNRQ